jgi:hypothetical protein
MQSCKQLPTYSSSETLVTTYKATWHHSPKIIMNKRFNDFYKSWKLLPMFICACHWILSWTRWIHSHPHPTYLKYLFQYCLHLLLLLSFILSYKNKEQSWRTVSADDISNTLSCNTKVGDTWQFKICVQYKQYRNIVKSAIRVCISNFISDQRVFSNTNPIISFSSTESSKEL